jgi:hypothetical protein
MCVSSFLALNSNKLGHIAITHIRGALSMNNSEEELNDDEEQTVDDFVDVPLNVKNSNFLADTKVVDGVDDLAETLPILNSRPNCCRIIKRFVVYLIVMSLFASFLK